MYAQIFFVTSVRGAFFTPQIFARASDRVFGAKMPLPAFFIAKAIFFPFAFAAVLPAARFAAVIFFNSALVIVVFFVVVVGAVVAIFLPLAF